MKFNEIHFCLDCAYTGRLYHTRQASQCPQCASRAVWPVSAWSKPPVMALPFHKGAPKVKQHACCEMKPTFLGGPYGYQQG